MPVTIASGTATTAELNTLYEAALKLQIALQPVHEGRGFGGASAQLVYNTAAQVDALVSAVSAAITSVNA